MNFIFNNIISHPTFFPVVTALAINFLGLTFILNNFNEDLLVVADGIGYHELANNIHNNLGFVRLSEGQMVPELYRTPGFPYLFSLFLDAGLGLKSYFIVISILCSIGVPVFGWFIARNFFAAEVALATAWLLALEPIIWLYNWTFLSEIPFLLASLTGAFFLVRAHNKNIVFSYDVILAGLFFGLSVYIRSAALPLVVVTLIIIFVERTYYFKKPSLVFLAILIVLFSTLIPWYQRVHNISGEYALSGTGWRNVYTDYLASIRSIKNDTVTIDEKNALKAYAKQTWNLTTVEINDPSNADVYREYSLNEIFNNLDTVIKLQSVIFLSYFTHTDYQRKLQKLGMLPMNKEEKGRVSSSRLVIKEGFGAVDNIYYEMKNRYFLPVFERIWSTSLFLLAIIGFFVTKARVKYFILALLIIGYLTSSAVGFGMEARMRIPILPFYFMLAGCGIIWSVKYLKKLKRIA